MGFRDEDPLPGGGRWRISDVARRDFGEIVPDQALGDPDSVVLRGMAGLVRRVEDEVGDMRVAIERVPKDGEATWREAKTSSVSANPRVLPALRNSQRNSFRSEEYAIAHGALWSATVPLPRAAQHHARANLRAWGCHHAHPTAEHLSLKDQRVQKRCLWKRNW